MMRHGETVANQEGYAAGSLDTPLTAKGRAQAACSEEAVFGLFGQIDCIVCSHLSRARDTALLVNRRLNLPLLINSKLAEQCFGEWRGMPWAQMMSRMKQGENPPGGETRDDFYRRANSGIEEAIDASDGTPLIVAHGGVFHAFFHANGLSALDADNCAIYRFSYDKKWNMALVSQAQQHRQYWDED